MRLLIVLQAEDSVIAENQIKELCFQLQRLCLPVNIVEQYGPLTTDVEIMFFSSKISGSTNLPPPFLELIEKCDLAVSKLYDGFIYGFKVIKDRKKSVVRDITENDFYCMLGKYYAFDYVELTKNDCE